MLIRNTTDSLYSISAQFRKMVKGDIRKLYYPMAAMFVILIGIIMHLALPTTLLVVSANMANFAAIIFPLIMIYLNHQLPKPARANCRNNLALFGCVLFYGFFFLNFIVVQLTGCPLVKF